MAKITQQKSNKTARHGERSAAIHAGEFGLLDCHASLAVTEKIRHSERSAAIQL
jgi:hypothetical protein